MTTRSGRFAGNIIWLLTFCPVTSGMAQDSAIAKPEYVVFYLGTGRLVGNRGHESFARVGLGGQHVVGLEAGLVGEGFRYLVGDGIAGRLPGAAGHHEGAIWQGIFVERSEGRRIQASVLASAGRYRYIEHAGEERTYVSDLPFGVEERVILHSRVTGGASAGMSAGALLFERCVIRLEVRRHILFGDRFSYSPYTASLAIRTTNPLR